MKSASVMPEILKSRVVIPALAPPLQPVQSMPDVQLPVPSSLPGLSTYPKSPAVAPKNVILPALMLLSRSNRNASPAPVLVKEFPGFITTDTSTNPPPWVIETVPHGAPAGADPLPFQTSISKLH